jgi:hypothetical protein
MSDYNIYPAVDQTFNFPPVVRQALALAPEITEATSQLVPDLVADPESPLRQLLDGLFISTSIVIDGGSP